QGRLTQNECEDLVTGGNLGKVDVGFQRQLLQFRQFVGGQFVVEVFRDAVGIQPAWPGRRRCSQSPAARDGLDAGNEFLGSIALGNLHADFLDFAGLEGVVQVGEQGSQSKAHDRWSLGADRGYSEY